MKYNKNKLRHQVTQYKRDILNKKSGKLSNNSKIKISRKNNNIIHFSKIRSHLIPLA